MLSTKLGYINYTMYKTYNHKEMNYPENYRFERKLKRKNKHLPHIIIAFTIGCLLGWIGYGFYIYIMYGII